jgi:hypothetical protein
MLLLALGGTALAAPALAKQPAYIGRWYLSFPAVCKGAPNETDGLLTYTAHEFIGLENRCRIVRAIPRGAATALSLSCIGEGVPYKTREIVKVVKGILHRTVKNEGKWETYTYHRCPVRRR